MKFKTILLSAMLSLPMYTSTASAGFFNFLNTTDACAQLPGNWEGSGTVTTKVMGSTIQCDYYGTGTVTQTGDHIYSASVDFDLVGGAAVCPGRQLYVVPGTCNAQTGRVEMKSSEVDLSGMLSSSGTQLSMTGTVKFPIMNRVVVGNVSNMLLNKQ